MAWKFRNSPISNRLVAWMYDLVSGELTYGLERSGAMYVFGVDNVYDLPYNDPQTEHHLTYGDVFLENERQQSAYNFEHADTDRMLDWFKGCEAQSQQLLGLDKPLPLPAYEQALRASHLFNLLDARGVISPTERQSFIARVRDMAKGAAQAWAAHEGEAR